MVETSCVGTHFVGCPVLCFPCPSPAHFVWSRTRAQRAPLDFQSVRAKPPALSPSLRHPWPYRVRQGGRKSRKGTGGRLEDEMPEPAAGSLTDGGPAI